MALLHETAASALEITLQLTNQIIHHELIASNRGPKQSSTG